MKRKDAQQALTANVSSRQVKRGRSVRVALCLVGLAAALALAPSAYASNPGDWTQQDVDNAIASGVTYLMSQQDLSGDPTTNSNHGRVGTNYPVTETSMLVISLGVLDQGHYNNLNAAQQNSAQAAVNYLLRQQDLTGTPQTNSNYGSWNSGFLQNYDTSLAVSALSFSGDVPTDPSLQSVATAMQAGRDWLIAHQTWPARCEPVNMTDQNQYDCGGFTYSGNPGNGADASNTGFSMTGIELSGGVPQQVADRNLVWQRKVQEIASNPVHHKQGGQDMDTGCGSYQPGFGSNGSFAYSNANDTGSLLFGFGYDGLNSNDSGVQAAIGCGNNLLSSYVLSKDVRESNALHSTTLDPPCHVGDAGCNYVVDGDGGYHYSMFSLSKGLGQFVTADLKDPNNFYAKVVDLLLSQQDTSNTANKGSWQPDGRDDATTIVATGFSIFALGRVGQPASISGTVYNDANGNGKRDAGESGMQGVTVYLDVNDNGSPDSGEPSAQSAADGTYTISGIQPDNYPSLREVVPTGNTCTQPNPCEYRPIQLVSGQALTGRDFGNSAEIGPPPPPPPAPGECSDKRRPTSDVTRLDAEFGGHEGLRAIGTARDFGPRACKGLRRVRVSLARITKDGKCHFVKSRHEFRVTGKRSCSDRFLFVPNGKNNWAINWDTDLVHGRYRIDVIAVDKSGNRQRPVTVQRFGVKRARHHKSPPGDLKVMTGGAPITFYKP